MLDYAQLHALAAILRTGSFEAAAAELSLTPSAISQRIKALEESLGAVLIRRGQPCTGTEAGTRLARHIGEVQLLEHMLAADMNIGTVDPAPVRVAVNADSLATWFLPALAAVPGLLFDLVVDDQDHSETWLRRGEVAAAVTSHAGPVQGCDSTPLGTLRYIATASPDYVAKWFPNGITSDALARAPAIVFDAKDQLQSAWSRRITGKRITSPCHRLPSSQGFVEAALLGLGWGMNPELLVRDHLANGRLIPLIPRTHLDVPLHWQISRMTGGALAPLTRAIRTAAANNLPPGPDPTEIASED